MGKSALAVCSFLAAGLVTGCAGVKLEPPPPPPTKVAVSVEGDPGQPIRGAVVMRGAKVVATTGPDGRAEMSLEGADGETVDANVRCPDGFTSPTKPITMRLTRMNEGRVPTFSVVCPPMLRKVVIAVKAENGPNLPILYLGKVVARTDGSGAAHFALEAPPGNQFQVTLDTTAKENAKLKPPSPSKPFTIGNTDDILVFEQKFDVEKKKFHAPPKPKLPDCLTCKS